MSEKLIDRLSMDQIEAILNALPIEFIFVDEKHRLQYYNKGEKRQRPGNPDLLGKDVRSCHKPESLSRVNKMFKDFKTNEKDEDEFWIGGVETKVLNRFFAVRDKDGKYLGCMEYVHDFNAWEKMAEDKKGSYAFLIPSDPKAET